MRSCRACRDDHQALGVLGQAVDAGDLGERAAERPVARGPRRGRGAAGGKPPSRPPPPPCGEQPLPPARTERRLLRRGHRQAAPAGSGDTPRADSVEGARSLARARIASAASTARAARLWCTSRSASRKRTSILVGVRSSTCSGSMSTNSTQAGCAAVQSSSGERARHRRSGSRAHSVRVDVGTGGRPASAKPGRRPMRPCTRSGRAAGPMARPKSGWAPSSRPRSRWGAGIATAPLLDQFALVPDREGHVGPRQRVAAHRLQRNAPARWPRS